MEDNMFSTTSRRSLLRSALSGACAVPFFSSAEAFAQGAAAPRDLSKDKRPVIHPDGPKFGVYDPHGDFKDEKGVATEHLFMPWEDVDLKPLPAADAYASERGRNILITIEPWSWAIDWNVSRAQLRSGILSGRYDANMRAILKVVRTFKSPVTIRWAQEMENPYNRFIWANWEPKDYITAFKRMHGIIREMLPKAQVMWSPRGEDKLTAYYPGDEYVDLVGLTVFGFERFDQIEYGHPRTFVEAVKKGYDLTVGYKKPIWVAELAYEGSVPYLEKWVNDVTANHPEYPELKEVVYFNDREVWSWPHNLGLPNWRVVADQGTIYPTRK